MHSSTKIVYVQHGTSLAGERRHHFGTTTLGRFRARVAEHRRDARDPFDRWAKAECAVVDYQIVKYACERFDEQIFNLAPEPEKLCPLCRAEQSGVPF